MSATALILSLAALSAAALPAEAALLPQGGVVTVGAATITRGAPNTLDINTTTAHTAITWPGFSIGQGGTVLITQPNSTSITVNQVTGGNPSEIFGTLRSNGEVVLTNPNGIWFGPGSHVDTAALVASTATASQASLQAFANGGNLALDQAGNANASVINSGSISIGNEGLAALVAPGVANNGIIAARLGQVVLASGSTATLDFYGDGLISFAVSGNVTATPVDQAGNPLAAAISNAGTINASGGTVLLTAAAAKTVVDNTINMSGVIVANAVNDTNGDIDLEGGSGSVSVSGSLQATAPSATGGTITVAGNSVQLAASARVTVTGTTGGTVSVSSDSQTQVAATIKAVGTTKGGSVTTEGQTLNVDGATVTASNWLLDAQSQIIDVPTAAAITQSLNANTSVMVQTDGTGGTGDITVNAPLSWTGDTTTLTLSAFHSINVNAGITATSDTFVSGGIVLTANNNISGTSSSGIINWGTGVTISCDCNLALNDGIDTNTSMPSGPILGIITDPVWPSYPLVTATTAPVSTGILLGFQEGSIADSYFNSPLAGSVSVAVDGTSVGGFVGTNQASSSPIVIPSIPPAIASASQAMDDNLASASYFEPAMSVASGPLITDQPTLTASSEITAGDTITLTQTTP